MNKLIQKYNVPGPRYTSYPTVPFWNVNDFTKQQWVQSFQETFHATNKEEGISLYIHLPFCESYVRFVLVINTSPKDMK
jgi:oxygen-independent coproporphyrinogen-3 oxidase